MYIGTNVLVYERWLVLKVRYMAGHLARRPAQRFLHSILTLLINACESKILSFAKFCSIDFHSVNADNA